MTALEASASSTSLSVIPPDGGVDHAHAHFFGVGFGHGLLQGFDRALHVGLDDQVDRLDVAGLHAGEHVVERDGAAAGQRRLTRERAPLLGDGLGAIDIFDDVKLVARVGQLVQTADDDRQLTGRLR